MAKDKKSKKIIATDSGKKSVSGNVVEANSSKKKKAGRWSGASNSFADTTGSSSRSRGSALSEELLFGRQNYLFVGIAFGLIILGMLLMMGGDMPDSNTWDESLIYSTRRTLIAPIVILIGLVVGVVAIFRD